MGLTNDKNELFRILDYLHQGVYVLDKDGNYIYANKSFLDMTGGTIEFALSLNAFTLSDSDIKCEKSVAVTAFRKKEKVTIINDVDVSHEYSYRQIATATPLFDELGRIEYMIVETTTLNNLNKEYQMAVLENEGIKCVNSEDKLSNIVCASPKIKALLSAAKSVACTDSTILVTGETGVGKQVLVNYIHANSSRADQNLVEINCATIPENLFESELFGYEKGAFTGALNEGKKGLIEEANGGTLFLDEINSMPLLLQSKLLRVLETKKCKRMGSNKERLIHFRLVSASNANLKKCIEEGTFRPDLYYRLSVISLEIPPLRERIEDIIPLAIEFCREVCHKTGIMKIISPNILRYLISYDWPGNVRELRNFIERMVLLSPPSSIQIDSFPENIGLSQSEVYEKGLKYLPQYWLDWRKYYTYDPANFSLKNLVGEYEAFVIQEVFKEAKNTYKTAEMLKTNQSTIARKMQKYGMHIK